MSKTKLSPKQEEFVCAYLETGNGTEAYKRAYNADNMTPQSIDKEVKLLLKHPLITSKIAKMNLKQEVRSLLTLEQHMDRLRVLSEKAEDEGKYSAAIAAEVKRGELRRFYVKQVETGDAGSFDNMSDEELDEFIRTNAADVLPQLQARKAAASRTRH